MKGTRVCEVKDGGVVQEEEEIDADLLVWTAGSQPSSLIQALDVRKDSSGRV
ncbi:unnamed protein product, partial [Hapterophycus canaliculatus]